MPPDARSSHQGRRDRPTPLPTPKDTECWYARTTRRPTDAQIVHEMQQKLHLHTHPRCVRDSASATCAHVFVHVSAVHKEEPRKEGKTRTHVVGLKKRKAFHRPPPTAYCAVLCCILAHRTKLSLAFSLTRYPLSFPEIDRERLCTAAGAINRLTFCWWWQLSHTHPHTVLRTHTRSRLNFVCQRRRM